MTLTLSIAALRRHRACGLDDTRVPALRRVLPDVAEEDPIPLRVWWDLPTTSVADRWWSLSAAEPALEARRLGVRGACLAARRVLHMVREQDRPACLAAIEAAEAWAEEPTEERATACRGAYCAAYATYAAATYAVYAAAAADGAYATYACADAATYACAAAAYAGAADATDDSADAEREAQRLDLDRLLAGMETP